MKLWGDALFNLSFNACASFWLALGLSLLIFRAFRLEQSRLGLVVLVLPFVKLVLEFARGVPRESFFWASEHGVRQVLGSFRIGFGFTAAGPLVSAQLWARHAGGISPQSAGDLAVRALAMKVGAPVAPVVAFAVVAASCLAVARAWSRRLAASARVRGLTERASLRELRWVGFRVVRVLDSDELLGAPFAVGILAPCVFLPRRLSRVLAPAELEAVVQHELAHIARFDAALVFALETLKCWFWYVPGIRSAVARVAAQLERRADDAALVAGVAAPALARALVTAAELACEHAEPDGLGMAGSESVLRSRLRRLLADVPAGSSSAELAENSRRALLGALKLAAAAWCALAMIRLVALGNHAP